MIGGEELVGWLERCGVTHLVWLPDSELGQWEGALVGSDQVRLIRACREGEAIAIAAGLWLGGAHPVVAIQCTGFFEAGDAIRNVVYDLGVPLFMLVGYRNYDARDRATGDSAPRFFEPILKAWKLPYRVIEPDDGIEAIAAFYEQLRAQNQAGVAALAERRL